MPGSSYKDWKDKLTSLSLCNPLGCMQRLLLGLGGGLLLPGKEKKKNPQFLGLTFRKETTKGKRCLFCHLLISPLLSVIYSMAYPARQRTLPFYEAIGNIQILLCFHTFATKVDSLGNENGKNTQHLLTTSSLISTEKTLSLACRFWAHRNLPPNQAFCLCYAQYWRNCLSSQGP